MKPRSASVLSSILIVSKLSQVVESSMSTHNCTGLAVYGVIDSDVPNSFFHSMFSITDSSSETCLFTSPPNMIGLFPTFCISTNDCYKMNSMILKDEKIKIFVNGVLKVEARESGQYDINCEPSTIPSAMPSQSFRPTLDQPEVPTGKQSLSSTGIPSSNPSIIPPVEPSHSKRSLLQSELPTTYQSSVPSISASTKPSSTPILPSIAPSLNPSTKHAPSASPSLRPSDKPTFLSNMHISSSPTVMLTSSSPSEYPTLSPKCSDNSSFIFQVEISKINKKKKKKKKNKNVTCNWLHHNEGRRDRYCNQSLIAKNCPHGCGIC